jgi:hypothetical protein
MTDYNAKQRALSIEYLKMRDKYLLDKNAFVPTNAVSTDIAKTIEQFMTTMNTNFARRCHK